MTRGGGNILKERGGLRVCGKRKRAGDGSRDGSEV